MIGQETQMGGAATRPRGRDFAIVAVFVAAVGLVGQAVILAAAPQQVAAPKSVVRLDAGPIEKRELVFSQHDRVADDSLRNFRPGVAWAPEPAPAVAMAAAIAAAPAVALAKPALRVKFAAVPRPPARPGVLAQRLPTPGPRALATAPDSRGNLVNIQFSRFIPTGADIMNRIGAVGSSLGKLMRVSSR